MSLKIFLTGLGGLIQITVIAFPLLSSGYTPFYIIRNLREKRYGRIFSFSDSR